MGQERPGEGTQTVYLAEGGKTDPGDLQGGCSISELRKHYFLEEYCIISPGRGKRPSDFRRTWAEGGKGKSCPFCPGNEDMTPPATAVYTPQGVFQDGQERVKGWLARCFPNRYPALEPETTLPISDWTVMPGFGYHEVIVESPEHGSGPGSFDPRTLRRMLEVYRDRYAHYMGQRGIEFVSIFKNSGLEAGASISHTHSQAIAMPLVPPLMQREISALKAAPSCPYCQIAHREASSPRAIQVKGDWIHLAPFASISPYETWIIPRSHVQDLTHMDEGMLQGLSEILGQAIKRMDLLLDHPPYNYMIHQAGQGYHFNIRIQPITSKAAGFEKDTGIFINTVPPEAAAEDLLSMKV